MDQEMKDGLYIDNSIIIIDEKKKGFPLSARVIQFLVIIAATWAGTGVLVETFGIPCNPFQVNAAILVSSAAFYALCLYPSYDIVKLFFGGLFYSLYFYSRLPKLANSFYILENLTMDRISAYYGTQNIQFVADYTFQVRDTTLLVIMILIPLTALLGITVVRSRLATLCSFLLFIPVIASFALGMIPSERYLIVCVVIVFYLTRSAFFIKNRSLRDQKPMLHRINSKAAVWLSLFSVLIFFVVKLFVTHDQYNDMTRIEEMKGQFQTAMNEFSWEDFTSKITDLKLFTTKVNYGGLSGGKLGKAGRVQYTNQEHLKIKAPLFSLSEGIYLKGYVGSVYTGDSWNGHSEKLEQEYVGLQKKLTEFSAVNQTSFFLSAITQNDPFSATRLTTSSSGYLDYIIAKGSMDVEYVNANRNFLYTPYFTDYEGMPDIRFNTDLYARPAIRSDNYSCNYFFNVAIDNIQPDFYTNLITSLGKYSEAERVYRNFVYKAYTILPKDGLDRIKKEFSSRKVKSENGSILESISYVRSYLEQSTEYSLSPGRLPRGKDFVEYFLYENRVGYCTHYASAATLMLRAMGIPARYVEGYAFGRDSIIGTEGLSEVTQSTGEGSTLNNDSLVIASVRDYNAHAWVEVYFDRIGWIPVEFTPGSTVDYTRTVVADADEITRNLNKEDLKAEQEVTVTPTPAVITPEILQQDKNADIKKNQADALKGNSKARLSDMLFLISIIAASILLTIVYYLVRRNMAIRARTTGDHNKRAILLYGDIERMLIFCRSLPKKALLEENESLVMERSAYIDSESLILLMGIVRKARFGPGMISGQELGKLIWCRDRLYHRLQGEQSILKKILLNLQLSL